MPAQRCRRARRQACPGAPRERPRERSEDRPIDAPEPSAPRLPTQDRQLMPQQEDLEFLRALRSAQQHHQLKQAAESQIDERPAHAQPPKLGKRQAIDLRAGAGLRARTEFLNPTRPPLDVYAPSSRVGRHSSSANADPSHFAVWRVATFLEEAEPQNSRTNLAANTRGRAHRRLQRCGRRMVPLDRSARHWHASNHNHTSSGYHANACLTLVSSPISSRNTAPSIRALLTTWIMRRGRQPKRRFGSRQPPRPSTLARAAMTARGCSCRGCVR